MRFTNYPKLFFSLNTLSNLSARVPCITAPHDLIRKICYKLVKFSKQNKLKMDCAWLGAGSQIALLQRKCFKHQVTFELG